MTNGSGGIISVALISIVAVIIFIIMINSLTKRPLNTFATVSNPNGIAYNQLKQKYVMWNDTNSIDYDRQLLPIYN